MSQDRQSLEVLYRAHAASAFRRARGLLGSEADAHEVVHDVFLSLVERPDQHAGHSRMSTFLYSAVTHACLNRLRDHRNRTRLLTEHASSLQPSAALYATPDRQLALRTLLALMPDTLAQLAVYRYMDELTHEEIAQVMGRSRRHIGDLLKRLNEWMDTRESAE